MKDNGKSFISDQLIEAVKKNKLIPVVGDDGLIIANKDCEVDKYGLVYVGPNADSCDVKLNEDGKWSMIHEEGIPTMTSNDCRCNFNTLEEAIGAAVNYLHGGPEVIGGWNVPTHKHPDWKREKIEELIRNAEHFSDEQWQPLFAYLQEQEEQLIYHANSDIREVTNEEFDAVQVIPVDHFSDPNKRLFVFRDLKQAFVVEK